MDKILGLVTGKEFNDNSWNKRSTRRRVFHRYPTGAFPLTGLLSMTEDDWTDSPEFGWQEKYRSEPETTVFRSAAVPFTDTGTNTATTSPITFAIGDLIRLHVADKSVFQAKNTIRVEDLPLNGGGTATMHFLVVSVVDGTEAIEVRALNAQANVLNTTNAIDGGTPGPMNAQVIVIGNANAEGGTSGSGIFIEPYEVSNYTQIFRNAFDITSTASKVPTDFDKSGVYKELAQDNLTEHMTAIERQMLFGIRSREYVTENGRTVPRRTSGGIEWYLQEYEAADSVYRGGTGAAALTANTDSNKRIITANGTLTGSFFKSTLMERLFRVTGSKSFEKICMCGSGFLGVMNDYLSSQITTNKNMRVETVYGMNITTWETPFGIVHFKSHPLFNNSAYRRYDGFFLDVGYLKYRPLKDRDTFLYKDRQANDEDIRKDEWLTEAGLELRHPPAHMLIKSLTGLT